MGYRLWIIRIHHLYGMQVLAGILIKVPNTSNLRRVWNLSHWTLGRSALALGIANIFIGMFLSSLAYKNIIAQAIVLGGLFIIVMLKNDIEYLLVGCTPAEEEAKLKAAGVIGMHQPPCCKCGRQQLLVPMWSAQSTVVSGRHPRDYRQCQALMCSCLQAQGWQQSSQQHGGHALEIIISLCNGQWLVMYRTMAELQE